MSSKEFYGVFSLFKKLLIAKSGSELLDGIDTQSFLNLGRKIQDIIILDDHQMIYSEKNTPNFGNFSEKYIVIKVNIRSLRQRNAHRYNDSLETLC